ncbi:MAG: molybdate ABC transporter substrate-binding protein [Candidatus Aureabacteria bacterium]|nr:molybdate ABC transporter substrate-binding protein [Candidatus Auribacterota bacterium]
MRRASRRGIALALILMTLPACGTRDRGLLFFCGSAVRVPMDEIIRNYEKETGQRISVTYGGSGSLLSQMELARRGDLYLAGSPDYITIGEKKKLLVPGTAKRVTYLVPAIIVPKGNPGSVHDLVDLARPGVRVGIGNPETVCLGLYGIELLDYNRLLDKVLKNNVTVFAKSCEDTAMLVVLKKVDAILGWDVFASWNPDAVEWIHIRADAIPRLSYVAVAIPSSCSDRARAGRFIKYILGEKGRAVFARWGYIADEAVARSHAPRAAIGGDYTLPARYYSILRHEQ